MANFKSGAYVHNRCRPKYNDSFQREASNNQVDEDLSDPDLFLHHYLSHDSIVVSTSRCGRENPGSNPGHGIFIILVPPHTVHVLSV